MRGASDRRYVAKKRRVTNASAKSIQTNIIRYFSIAKLSIFSLVYTLAEIRTFRLCIRGEPLGKEDCCQKNLVPLRRQTIAEYCDNNRSLQYTVSELLG